MNKPIMLDLEEFACVKQGRSPIERGWRDPTPRWVRQLQALRVDDDNQTTAASCALLTIEYGVKFTRPELWNSTFVEELDGLCKFQNKRTFALRHEKQVDQRGNLHSDNGFALRFKTRSFYFLHGLLVEDPKWVLTPAENLDPKEILAIRNVDLRRELIRKKGVEQLLDGLFTRTIDQSGDYSLIQVVLGRDVDSACNFLKMLNPSIGVWHVEGVPNEIRTVREALLWRNQQWFEHAEDIT